MLPRVFELSRNREYPLLVDSGRGAQVWLRPVGEPRATWEGLRLEFGDLLACYDCKLDPTHDASRLARVPGTVNLKTRRVARIISIPRELPRHLAETLSGRRQDLNDRTRSSFEMATADALAAFNLSQAEIEALLRAYPHGRGEAEHSISRKITARKAVEQRAQKGFMLNKSLMPVAVAPMPASLSSEGD